MTIINILTRLLATVAGGAVVLGLTAFLIDSQSMDHAHALKAWVIAGGIIAGGLLLPWLTGKAKAFLIVGVICAELFNIGSVAEQNWRERASRRAEVLQANTDAKADHQKRLNAYTSADQRLTRAESALDTATAKRAADAKEKFCKAECGRMHADAVAKAEAEVTAARAEAKANPKPTAEPVEVNPDAGAVNWQWDLAMGILGSIGGNLIGLGLMSFASSSRARPDTRSARQPQLAPLPSITAVDVSVADAVLLQAENDRALAAMRQSLDRSAVVALKETPATPTMLPAASELSGLAGLFAGPVPDRPAACNVVELFGTNRPEPPQPPKGGRRTVRPDTKPNDRKADVLADIQARIDRGERFESQEALRQALSGRFGNIPKSTLSEWLAELSASISRRQDGRRKVVG